MKTTTLSNISKFAIAAIGTAIGLTETASAQSYQVIDLGTLGGSQTYALGVNNLGMVAGYGKNASGYDRAYWYDGSMHVINPFTGGLNSRAYAINDNGWVVGYSAEDYGGIQRNRGFYRNPVSGIYKVGNFAASDAYQSYAWDINNSNMITGYASGYVGGQDYHALRYEPGVGLTHISPLSGLSGENTYGYAINDNNVVVGQGDTSGSVRAFRATTGSVTNLGIPSGSTESYAYDINNFATTVGDARINSSTFRAWYKGAIGTFVYLPMLPGASVDDSSGASAINESGVIVGSCEIGNTNHRATMYNGSIHDLNDMIPAGSGWVLRSATDISDTGYIVGYGEKGGMTKAFLLKPMITVSGHINLENWMGLSSGTVRIDFLHPVTGISQNFVLVNPSANGDFSFQTTWQGSCKFSLKKTHWLRQNTATYTVDMNGLSNIQFSLANGDCDEDNEVTLADYSLFAASFGKALGDPGFNTNADLDGDLEVTLADYSILATNFGQSGD